LDAAVALGSALVAAAVDFMEGKISFALSWG